jgi:hypothetical protein
MTKQPIHILITTHLVADSENYQAILRQKINTDDNLKIFIKTTKEAISNINLPIYATITALRPNLKHLTQILHLPNQEQDLPPPQIIITPSPITTDYILNTLANIIHITPAPYQQFITLVDKPISLYPQNIRKLLLPKDKNILTAQHHLTLHNNPYHHTTNLHNLQETILKLTTQIDKKNSMAKKTMLNNLIKNKRKVKILLR